MTPKEHGDFFTARQAVMTVGDCADKRKECPGAKLPDTFGKTLLIVLFGAAFSCIVGLATTAAINHENIALESQQQKQVQEELNQLIGLLKAGPCAEIGRAHV